MTIINTFIDGSTLFFDDGAFDKWCVYLKKINEPKYAPTDLQYFSRLNELGDVYRHKKIYMDFVRYYEVTTADIDTQILNLIHRISEAYSIDKIEIEILFTIIYAGMIAEENKQNAILKKRIKRLGMHQVLIDRLSPEIAANFSRGKNWKELNTICLSKGF
jgi:hypothetical protein